MGLEESTEEETDFYIIAQKRIERRQEDHSLIPENFSIIEAM